MTTPPTPNEQNQLLTSVFRAIVARRWWVVAIYAVLLGPCVWFALKVDQDNTLDRLIVKSDPDYIAAQAFAKTFGQAEYALILADAPDPFRPEVLARVDAIEQALCGLQFVECNSPFTTYRRMHPGGFHATPEEAEAFRRFATGTDFFRKQGIVSDRSLSIPLLLNGRTQAERRATLVAINAALAPFEKTVAPLESLHKVGQPYVNDYLDGESRRSGLRYFPLFGLFVFVLNILLYRSFRTLAAFIITLAVSAAMTVGYIGLTGGTFTIVSSLVPMTILITCTATLVYLHSRYVECPPDRSQDDHQIFALVNKFLACTASVFATAIGFAALAVSKIRPIREMGIWVAVGLVFTWIIVFTLFPALQKILRTPTERERKAAGQWFLHVTNWLPGWTYRWRWVMVPGSLLMCAWGAISLFGFPGLLAPARLETSPVEYINHSTALYRDTKRLESSTGLALTEVWVRHKQHRFGSVTDAKVLRGLDHFHDALEKTENIGAVVGPTSLLRMLRYVDNKGDKLPDSDDELQEIADSVEAMLPREPMLQRFIDKTSLAETHLAVVTRTIDYEGYVKLDALVQQRWKEAVARDPALADFDVRTVGLAPLQAKISFHLVPTLVESFALTVGIIFVAFLLVFRNGAARIMAMIPSLFAILVMFGIMRATGMTLNVATILIASTVLGTSENDQIHFFYHFLEKRGEKNKQASAEAGLRYTLNVAGRAIFFATLINAGGFLAFGLADLPPMRQFGILSALAFVLSMIADFTALPAALWLVLREKPDQSPAPPNDDDAPPKAQANAG